MGAIVPDQTGSIGILNVGHGDTKIVFDKNNPADCIRAARIIKDMLRRGYALLVEVEQPDGSKKFQRVYDFKEDSYEYVIADMDPLVAAEVDKQESEHEQAAAQSAGENGEEAGSAGKRGRPKLRTRRIEASATRGVAIGRTAGG